MKLSNWSCSVPVIQYKQGAKNMKSGILLQVSYLSAGNVFCWFFICWVEALSSTWNAAV